jgi:hypothetical protein
LATDGALYQAGHLPATELELSDKSDMWDDAADDDDAVARAAPTVLADRPAPVALPEPSARIFAAAAAACVLTTAGNVYMWGAAADWPGQLLTARPERLALPVVVAQGDAVILTESANNDSKITA